MITDPPSERCHVGHQLEEVIQQFLINVPLDDQALHVLERLTNFRETHAPIGLEVVAGKPVRAIFMIFQEM